MSKVRYGQSGYCGFSRSRRAAEAEAEYKAPISRAVGLLANEARITRATARRLLLAEGPCEWHHTSLYARATDYYDWGSIADAIDDADYLDRVSDDTAEIIEALDLPTERAGHERAARVAQRAARVARTKAVARAAERALKEERQREEYERRREALWLQRAFNLDRMAVESRRAAWRAAIIARSPKA